MKKIISVLLSLCVLCSAIPMYVFAENHSLELVFENDYITTYAYNGDGCDIVLQNLNETTIQATIISEDETRILNIGEADLGRFFVFGDETLWDSALEYVLSHIESSEPLQAYCEELVVPITFSATSTGGEAIISQMASLYGNEHSPTVVYSANDSYNSQVLEELEYIIRLGSTHVISQGLSVASFVSGVLGYVPFGDLYKKTCNAISVAAGGASLITGSRVLTYDATAQYYQYGYCMGEPQVYYSAEECHHAYGVTDEYGVYNGEYVLCTEPYYSAAPFPFDSYQDIVSAAISAYLN